MARQEHDREDLLREATAMVERAELQVSFWPEPVFVGFRRESSFSVYFGGDPVLQFNAEGEVRRAFFAGLLYKAETGQLVELRRERTERETLLLRRELTAAETTSLLARSTRLLNQLSEAIDGANDTTVTVLGQVPSETDVLRRVKHWLKTHAGSLTIAAGPRAG